MTAGPCHFWLAQGLMAPVMCKKTFKLRWLSYSHRDGCLRHLPILLSAFSGCKEQLQGYLTVYLFLCSKEIPAIILPLCKQLKKFQQYFTKACWQGVKWKSLLKHLNFFNQDFRAQVPSLGYRLTSPGSFQNQSPGFTPRDADLPGLEVAWGGLRAGSAPQVQTVITAIV